MRLDNSSCNLASLNLLKFLKDDDTLRRRRCSRRRVELVITAMDISICFADFPTEAIGETTRDYRQLGIGYANLGALLMASGLGYDSDGGRALAAAITSLMTGTSYKRSAELAGVVGPYDGYARNADAHKRVMRKHAGGQRRGPLTSRRWTTATCTSCATKAWADVVKIGEKNGWRNAQASVLAPTGTIGFMMDCDTTGIEPDFSLVKFKKLVGGGSMQIVNQTIPRALTKLGYADETIEAIVEYIAEHGHVIDAPGLQDRALRGVRLRDGRAGDRPMGHVRMMAAAQPFLSGAISKTVNLPESATVEEIADVYFQGWKLGLKALAVYRDNCKVGQPLSRRARPRAPTRPSTAEAEVVEKVDRDRPIRKRLPKSRPSLTTSFTVGGAEGYMTAGSYPDDGLGEVFLKLGKQGSTLAGVMDAFSMAISISLQYGVPLETYVSKFTNMQFEPAGTDRRPGHPDEPVDHGLHLPPAGAGLPAVRDARRARHLHRRGAPAPARHRLVRGGRGGRGLRGGVAQVRARVRAARRRRERHGRRAERRRRQHRAADRRPTVAETAKPAPAGGPHHRGAVEASRPRGRLAAVLHLRHQDAPGRLLLRLRRLRQHLRLQLN